MEDTSDEYLKVSKQRTDIDIVKGGNAGVQWVKGTKLYTNASADFFFFSSLTWKQTEL